MGNLHAFLNLSKDSLEIGNGSTFASLSCSSGLRILSTTSVLREYGRVSLASQNLKQWLCIILTLANLVSKFFRATKSQAYQSEEIRWSVMLRNWGLV